MDELQKYLPAAISKHVGPTLLAVIAFVTFLRHHKDFFSFLAHIWSFVVGSKDERAHRDDRLLLTEFIGRKLDELKGRSQWSEEHFTQLEAEVEVETLRSRLSRWLPWSSKSAVRRVTSLSRALRTSRERLIVLVGDPGAGKTVALRRVAREILDGARLPQRFEPIIPIYVNLRDLERGAGIEIDAALIRSTVRHSLRHTRADAYLDEHFESEMQRGRFFFLFDSFDEIPDVLASTSGDDKVARYHEAIRSFVMDWSRCRAILATRDYRSPREDFGVARFRILNLSLERQQQLVQHYAEQTSSRRRGAPFPTEALLAFLGEAKADMLSLLANPMFLTLVCQRMGAGEGVPSSAREVFQSFVTAQLRKVEPTKSAGASGATSTLLEFASHVAFEMVVNPEFGLSPARHRLIDALEKRGSLRLLDAEAVVAEAWLDALERSKIGQPGDDPSNRCFSFAHRRLQEFFAAERLAGDPSLVSVQDLLSNAQWRDAAIVLLQTRAPAASADILAGVHRLLEEQRAALATTVAPMVRAPIDWKPSTVHVLGILDGAYAGHVDALPEPLVRTVVAIATRVRACGSLLDLKWILEVIGLVPEEDRAALFPSEAELEYDLLRDTVMRELSTLPSVTSDVDAWLHKALVVWVASGSISGRRSTILSQVRRLREPHRGLYLDAMRLAAVLRYVNSLVCLTAATCIASVFAFAPKSTRFRVCGELPACHRAIAGLLGWRDNVAISGLISHATVACICVLLLFGWVIHQFWMRGFISDWKKNAAMLWISVLWMLPLHPVIQFLEPRGAAEMTNRMFWLVLAGGLWMRGATVASTRRWLMKPGFWGAYAILAVPWTVWAWVQDGQQGFSKWANETTRRLRAQKRAILTVGAGFVAVYALLAIGDVPRLQPYVAVPLGLSMFAILVGFPMLHVAGELADRRTITKLTSGKSQEQLRLEEFLDCFLQLHGAEKAHEFIALVESRRLLERGEAASRALAALQSVIDADRASLKRWEFQPFGEAPLRDELLARLTISLLLDRGFGRFHEAIVRSCYKRLDKRPIWQGRYESTVRQMPVLSEIAVLRTEPWRTVTRGAKASPLLLRLADQVGERRS